MVGSLVRKGNEIIFLVILLLMHEVSAWSLVVGSGSLVGCED
jgi:hypothetical protein